MRFSDNQLEELEATARDYDNSNTREEEGVQKLRECRDYRDLGAFEENNARTQERVLQSCLFVAGAAR